LLKLGRPASQLAASAPCPCAVGLQWIGSSAFPSPFADPAPMDIVLGPIIDIAIAIIRFYTWVVIAAAIMSWLVAFGVVNTYNRLVHTLNDFLYRITEPALRPLRRFIPNLGGVDITPVVLIFILWLITDILLRIQFRYG